MKRPATKPKAKPRRSSPPAALPNITLSTPVMYVEPIRPLARDPAKRGTITARKLAAARRELRTLLQVAEYFAGGTTSNETIIERINAALDALR